MNNGYYGNGRGLVIGPYSDNEIRAKARAVQWLQQNGTVYFVRARNFAVARDRIYREAAREQREHAQR